MKSSKIERTKAAFATLIANRILRSAKRLLGLLQWGWRRGDLGETLQQSILKMGESVRVWEQGSYFPQYEFSVEEYALIVSYLNGVACRAWAHAEKFISEESRKDLLDRFSCGLAWLEQPSVRKDIIKKFAYSDRVRNRYWERSDRRAWACLAQTGTGLSDLTFHMDFTSTRWQEVKNVRFGVWSLKSERKIDT